MQHRFTDSNSGLRFPVGVDVFERGWLSSNSVLLVDHEQCVLIDSGYCTHHAQTLDLVAGALDGKPLDTLVNTHLHSDHCGGNAALQSRYPGLTTWIPPGGAGAAANWSEDELPYAVTGQSCPRFSFDGTIEPGSVWTWAGLEWEVHAAPGHDPDAILLFAPAHGILISADALWEDGFGVVFPELEGDAAFSQVEATLNLIESLNAEVVIPGHGRVFADVPGAVLRARKRLDYFVRQPERHALYAAKVLVKFKLLELQRCRFDELMQWAQSTPYVRLLQQRLFPDDNVAGVMDTLIKALVDGGAAAHEGHYICNRN